MTKQESFNNAMNCGDFNAASELAETMNKEELIPCDDELNRLKEFLATVACGRSLSPEMREAYAQKEPFSDGELMRAGKWRRVTS